MKRIGIARSRYDVCQGNKTTELYRGTSSRDDTQYSEAVEPSSYDLEKWFR